MLLAAAAGGLGLAGAGRPVRGDVRAGPWDLPDEDPDRDFADRGVRLVTTFRAPGSCTGT